MKILKEWAPTPCRLFLVGAIGIGGLLVLAGLSVGLCRQISDFGDAALATQADAFAVELALFTEHALANEPADRGVPQLNPRQLAIILEDLAAQNPNAALTVFDATGAVIARSKTRHAPSSHPFIRNLDLEHDGRRLGRAVIELPRSGAAELHRSVLWSLGLLFACGWPVMTVLMILNNRTLGSRLTRIENAATRIANGDFDVILPAKGGENDGVTRIEARFNFMAQSLNEQQHQLHYMAYFDSVTGLPNRAGFIDALTEACKDTSEGGAGFVVAVFDVDRFKDVNDVFGHAAGDELLARLSLRLRHHLGEHTVIGRLSGDEFAILLAGQEDLAEVTQQLHQAANTVCQPVRLRQANAMIHISFSIGVALCPTHFTGPVDLLKATDLALKEAKAAGGSDLVAFQPELAASLERRHAIEGGLRDAMENGELSLVYHPLVTCRSGQIDSAEALLRWQHPSLGAIPPTEFIPIAEHSGLIKPLGLWVLRRACAQLQEWTAAGLETMSVAVNVSVAQIIDEAFETEVLDILEQENVPPSRIVLEVTESIFAGPWFDRILSHLEGLRSKGIRIAIDDFGTGYSSLAYVRDLPIDEIKIDRAFVRPVADCDRAYAILVSICRMVRTMGNKSIVAEGVESEAHLRRIVAAGCDLAQGYFLSEPISGAQLVPWWETQGRAIAGLICSAQADGLTLAPSSDGCAALGNASHAEDAETGLPDGRIEACG